ncbi:MAG: hypothetical protein SH857_18600 [Chitinophagales bacterium]|nr:hypothetical protein [Chitinophagales bacterium]
MYRIIYIFAFIFFSSVLDANGNYDFNSRCQNAYNEIFSLRIDAGKQLLAKEKTQYPDNLIPLLLESYIDLLSSITTDNAALLSELKSNKNVRLNSLKKGDQNSPWHRYVQAEVQLHYALAAFQHQEYWSGLMDMRKTYFLLEENIRLYPAFKPNYKSYSTIQALLGAVPEKYAWGLRLVGLEGNLNAGMLGLEKLITNNWSGAAFLKDETVHIYIHLLFHLEGDKEKAWKALHESNYPLEENLFSYSTALKISLYSYHNDDALQLLEKIPAGKEYAAIPMLSYYAGLAHLHKLESKEAIINFQQFLSQKAGSNFEKSANQKIAWSYLINGDAQSYKQSMRIVSEDGIAQNEADKQAQKEVEDALPPHPEILKARLLFDGGYFEQSLKTLENIHAESLSNNIYSLELVYRKARVLHEMNDTLRAIESYMVTMSKGRNEPYYYVANSALNLALIYESKGNKELAKKYFNDCLALDNHEYRVSLAQKAKAGLQRLEP